ncbi:MAG: chorismate synthase [Lachnospiraceae bacterium]|jgi:chorismate synthase|nr:chorismate synthase [Lachnospiraceae bacterium]
MAGSSIGCIFRVTTWGESHGSAIGAVVDGCPSGIVLDTAFIQSFLNRRKPGQSEFTTKRTESDEVEILSGVFDGKTTGTPISLIIRNRDMHFSDYDDLKDVFRPGHADYTYEMKYGIRDYRGGGRSSGRETAARVAAGAVAMAFLRTKGIHFLTYTKSIGNITVPISDYHLAEISENSLYMPSNVYAAKASDLIKEAVAEKNSVGGIIEGQVYDLQAGIGEPVFSKLDAELGKAFFSIGAVKGVEFGDGFAAATMRGSEHNDAFIIKDNGISKSTNHAGGILGGISDGSPLVYRLAVKPTASIAQPQNTVNNNKEAVSLNIKGRHDPCIVPRAVVVAEAMAAITIADLLLLKY